MASGFKFNSSLSQIKSQIADPQTGLYWYLEFTGGGSVIASDLARLAYRAASCDIPKEEQTHTAIQLGGHTIQYAGKGTTGATGINIALYESTNNPISGIMEKWASAYYHKEDAVGSPTAKLKFDMKIYLGKPVGVNQIAVSRIYNLTGCMAKFSTGLQLNQDATPEQLTMTIDCDKFERTIIQ